MAKQKGSPEIVEGNGLEDALESKEDDSLKISKSERKSFRSNPNACPKCHSESLVEGKKTVSTVRDWVRVCDPSPVKMYKVWSRNVYCKNCRLFFTESYREYSGEGVTLTNLNRCSFSENTQSDLELFKETNDGVVLDRYGRPPYPRGSDEQLRGCGIGCLVLVGIIIMIGIMIHISTGR